MKTEEEGTSTFLAHLSDELKKLAGVDSELAEIVVEHLLTPAPVEDCVQLAEEAIRALASARTTVSDGIRE